MSYPALIDETGRLVKPEWLKAKAPGSPEYMQTRDIVKSLRLHTVCEEARCPNIGECWSHSTATFMIMGDLCTRRCHFCSVKKGTSETLQPLDPIEPERVGRAVKALSLKHAVITSVDRDDIADNGAEHFRRTVAAIKKYSPECKIELLIPDLKGSREDLRTIVASGINVLNHNVETIPRLYKKVRPGAGYIRSLSILRWAKEFDPAVLTKSGIMVGLGETFEEVLRLMDDLRYSGVDIMTIGQYLRPSARQTPVRFFVTPDEFKLYEEEGLKRGFRFVESGPLVRSSYHAWKHTK
ncbi:MAG TPA: lipoyl synthase [Oligoflexia bacterium]|nr:lipoyl synthase [Oligoflexia bacterium]HMP26655.1 lipoyl synthase [Oligoflexia bacterium]